MKKSVTGDKIRLALVDDHEVVRHGLKLALEVEPDMVVVGEARRGIEAVSLAAQTRPDVMLLDVRLEDIDGPEVCRRVLAASSHTAVLMLTNYLQDELVFRSLVAGAKGYVIKDVELHELKKMIRTVHRGDAVLDPRITTPVISEATATAAGEPGGQRALSLSDSDMAILRHLSQGLTNQEIAREVHLSRHTVKDRIEKLRALLGVRSRTAIVAEAHRRGLV